VFDALAAKASSSHTHTSLDAAGGSANALTINSSNQVNTLGSINVPLNSAIGRDPMNATSPRGILWDGTGTLIRDSANIDFIIDDDNNNGVGATNFRFLTNSLDRSGTELMRLRDDGYLGIGTDNPANKLHVYGNASVRIRATNTSSTQYSSSGITLENTEVADGEDQWHLFAEKSEGGAGTGTTNFQIRKRNESQSKVLTPFLIDANNNVILQSGYSQGGQSYGWVGIGTNDPVSMLDVRTGSGSTTRGVTSMQVSDDVVGGAVTLVKRRASTPPGQANDYAGVVTYQIYNSSSNRATVATVQSKATNVAAGAESGTIEFLTANAGSVGERMRLSPDGNLGIGTDNPTAKLHIAGTAGVDGIKFPDGTLQTTAAHGPVFNAYMAGSNSSTPANVLKKVPYNTDDFDPDGVFDTTNNRFVPNRAGYYQVQANVFTSMTGAGGSTMVMTLRKNGTDIRGNNQLINYSGAINQTMTIDAIVYMNGTTDYLEAYWMNNGATSTAVFGSGITYMHGSFLRP
jgi:hypothetical protein